MKKRVLILGSTGSIGRSALTVVRKLPERIEVVGLAAGKQLEELRAQAEEFRPNAVGLYRPPSGEGWRRGFPGNAKLYQGALGLSEMVAETEADLVLVAIVGTAGLGPSLAAIRTGKSLALASKEVLVMAGEIVMAEARARKIPILPVDSEHNAVFQCLAGAPVHQVRRIVLTASGGPFRTWDAHRMESATVEDALDHPTWKMGKKITIDSATLFNKALEMIEAHWLFSLPLSAIDVVVHPQSIVHSLVEFVDGSQLAQLSHSDMCLPIQYAFTYPERFPSPVRFLNLATVGRLSFEEPDHERFPALRLARRAGESGGTAPCVLNAANEVAVAAFLQRQIPFPAIWRCVEAALDAHEPIAAKDLEVLQRVDEEARVAAVEWIRKRG
ncbi:1-deoxy-D-xylulose-5-phosphate reductoisomerase [Methylacidimicrobium cyclopophantes]|uniref:1-deoxy-D-xylulose 5-phosphate reductoisomerase n=1 Tax=Methylacidimicrobium cyclopophantes TaxID=1041766 RepID=A0A5E6MBI8_9BACT|nr:1-deoxy-D-xylulose-5-phosphate reductoisomerase [Methylacidimicrobium cyclopophantes]VVM05674.1 1-deoxy-D-xylulose-5-phosphate reductoisomerase [Methylacidimicrobium cyclopophantes]